MRKALTKPHLQRLAGAALLLLLLAAAQAAVIEARTTAYVYDSKGQLIREIAEPQDSTVCLVNVYGQDAHGNRTSTQPRNRDGATAIPGVGTEAAKPTGTTLFTTGAVQVRYEYPGVNSATERKITTTNALGHQGVAVQDTAFGTPLSRTDANGLVEYGNLTQQTYGNGVTTTRSDDFMQRLLTSRAGTGNAVQNDSYSYHYAGNLRSCTETRAGAILTSRSDVGTYTYPAS
ncbi:MAG TPA: hypothetical protein VFL86_24990, partial [Burkholderiaceae bacterium]|nr:hypothetical protein [Burkholderiaceae bacterium]